MLLKVDNLTVAYGNKVAIEDVSFSINSGQIISFVGANGAGKSTALKAINGTILLNGGRFIKGKIEFGDTEINQMKPHEIARLGIATILENNQLFQSMTVLENLEIGAQIHKNSIGKMKNEIDEILSLFPILKSKLKEYPNVLSGGEKKIVAIAQSLMLKPKLLLADEPTVALSPKYIDIIFNIMKDISRSGIAIIVVEQRTTIALDICDIAYIYNLGKITDTGNKNDLMQKLKF
jgi:branched-chain amino acid transport system ATP-binding protein